VANEIARQDAFLSDTEGLVAEPLTFERSRDSVEEELSSRLKSYSKNNFDLLNKLTINNTSIRKGFYMELSPFYLVEVLELLVDQHQDVYVFGRSCDLEEDEKTGIFSADAWEPNHNVLVRLRPYTARVVNDKEEYFDSDVSEKPLIPYSFQGYHLENSVPVFF